MLCDEILADKTMPIEYPGFVAAQACLRGAHKYVLAPDFTAAADGLVDNRRELERIAPFCRLPSSICWFEWAQADRPHFKDAPIHVPEFQAQPKRVGFLLIAPKPDKLWSWATHLMWSMAGPPRPGHEMIWTPNNASIITVAIDTKDGYPNSDAYTDGTLSKMVEVVLSPFCPADAREMFDAGDHRLINTMQSDWGGEVRFLFAMLGLFNARNVMETQPVDNTHYNKKRAKAGQKPLESHTVLKIRAMHRRSLIGQRGKGTHADIREHFVSGHWKTRKTGLFWWNPFWRGNPVHGKVTHDHYDVTT